MLWTLGGLCLLLGLGVVTGICGTIFVTNSMNTIWKNMMFFPCLAAGSVAIYLITQWASPAGGG